METYGNNTQKHQHPLSLNRSCPELLQEYQGTESKPEGEMKVTKISGIVNGDWSDGNNGWLTQGMSNLVGGVKYLHEFSSGTYSTQTVFLDSKDQGIRFDMKSQPIGGEISLQVRLMGITVFEETYTGANAEWDTEVIPFDIVMTMREEYGFSVEGIYTIQF